MLFRYWLFLLVFINGSAPFAASQGCFFIGGDAPASRGKVVPSGAKPIFRQLHADLGQCDRVSLSKSAPSSLPLISVRGRDQMRPPFRQSGTSIYIPCDLYPCRARALFFHWPALFRECFAPPILGTRHLSLPLQAREGGLWGRLDR